MSQRRKRSRSPLAGRERKKYENERRERYKKHASNAKQRDEQHQSYVSGQERIVDERYHRNEDCDKERCQGMERRRHGDRKGRKDSDNHPRNKHQIESRQRRERERTTDSRQERSQNENRGNRRLLHNERDQRPVREEETEDSSRYGQPANTEGSNTEDTVGTEQPNFALSGKLTEYTNTYKGVVIKYNEPPEARKPKTRWRLYPFKGEETLPVLYIHRQSAFLLGRQRHIADIPIDHPSCSKQHAVLQYKLAEYLKPDGTLGRKVKPYIIDLESANGTFLNNERIDARRYYELKEQDVLKFGFSSREYVILHERSLKKETEDISASSEDSPE